VPLRAEGDKLLYASLARVLIRSVRDVITLVQLVQARRYGTGHGKEHGALRCPYRQARLAQVRASVYRVVA
jgi:hypothetical protein